MINICLGNATRAPARLETYNLASLKVNQGISTAVGLSNCGRKVAGEREQIDHDAKHYIKDTRGKFCLRARGHWREALQ
jgi:hypothetical protein